jgi:hypothetical protein
MPFVQNLKKSKIDPPYCIYQRPSDGATATPTAAVSCTNNLQERGDVGSHGVFPEKSWRHAIGAIRPIYSAICAEYQLIHTVLLPELVFTVLTLHILYWTYEIYIHSHVFILDLLTSLALRI